MYQGWQHQHRLNDLNRYPAPLLVVTPVSSGVTSMLLKNSGESNYDNLDDNDNAGNAAAATDDNNDTDFAWLVAASKWEVAPPSAPAASAQPALSENQHFSSSLSVSEFSSKVEPPSVPVSSPACSLPACGCSQCDCSKVLHPRCCSQVLTQVHLLEDRPVQLQLPRPTLRPPWLLLYSTPVIIIITTMMTMIIITAMIIIMVMLVMLMRCFWELEVWMPRERLLEKVVDF